MPSGGSAGPEGSRADCAAPPPRGSPPQRGGWAEKTGWSEKSLGLPGTSTLRGHSLLERRKGGIKGHPRTPAHWPPCPAPSRSGPLQRQDPLQGKYGCLLVPPPPQGPSEGARRADEGHPIRFPKQEMKGVVLQGSSLQALAGANPAQPPRSDQPGPATLAKWGPFSLGPCEPQDGWENPEGETPQTAMKKKD